MFTKQHPVRSCLFALAIALIVLGILFLLNAMETARIFPAFYDISNVLAKYIVVIITMACGIMLFSNLATRIEQDKLRNGLTIGITTFSTVLTVPLVYVFIAIFPLKAAGAMGPVGKIMALDRILAGFEAWFGGGAFLYVVLVVMLLLSIVFISFPLLTGILAVKGKTIVVGKQKNGKFGIGLAPLPVLAARAAADETSDTSADEASDTASEESPASTTTAETDSSASEE